jgi:6-pyruvoyltetrahydropterin/6-carboxytetrahydropterin synthase
MGRYISTKLFDNFSVALRQHKAQHSHCCKLHGYALKFKVWFSSVEPLEDKQLDDMNWIVDYGGFKAPPNGNGLKDWLNYMFDHTTLIEKDDPYLDIFKGLEVEGLLQLRIMDKMGAESCAKLVYNKFNEVLSKTDGARCKVIKVECFENDNNSSIYEENNNVKPILVVKLPTLTDSEENKAYQKRVSEFLQSNLENWLFLIVSNNSISNVEFEIASTSCAPTEFEEFKKHIEELKNGNIESGSPS